MNNLGQAYMKVGRLDEAIPLSEQSLAATKSLFGNGHQNTLISMDNLALLYQAAGRLDQGVSLAEKTLATMEDKLGPDNDTTLITMVNLAGSYCNVGRIDEALALFERALSASRIKWGEDHPDTLDAVDGLCERNSRQARCPRRCCCLNGHFRAKQPYLEKNIQRLFRLWLRMVTH